MEKITNVTQDVIKQAAKALKEGHLVAFPTETVYGLGADATNKKAVGKVFSVKGRPSDHPLIVHIASINRLDDWAVNIPDYAVNLANELWPGPMTLILKRSGLAKNFITGNQDTVGLRIPSHPISLDLLEQFQKIGGVGIAAPSANKFGCVSPTEASHVVCEIGKDMSMSDLILDGGQCSIGLESTIIDCTDEKFKILRPGAITLEVILETLNHQEFASNPLSNIRVSGSHGHHYAPKAKILFDQIPTAGQGYIALSTFQSPPGVIRLASPSSLQDFARNLYTSMRKADELGLQCIVVQRPAGGGIAVAIRDRLNKAANRI